MASPGAIKAGEASVTLSADDRLLTGALKRWERRFSTAGRAVANSLNAGFQAGIAGAAALTAGMVPATASFISFDDAMLAAKAKTQATEEEFASLKARALDLAGASGFGATEVAKLMVELGTAGFTATEVDKMTESVLLLARAAGTEAATAAGLLGSMTKQFGLSAKDASRLADQLTQAANKSAVSVESLSETFAYLGPVAHDLGATTDEMLALVGVLGNVGIKGSEAGTALRRLSLLSADGQKLKDLFNVSGTDDLGNARKLVDVLADIQKAVADMPSGERAAKLTEAFGLLGVTSASALSKATVNVKDLHDQIVNSAGVAKRTAEEMDSGLGGTWRRLKAGAEKTAIAIGTVLAPVLQTVGAVIGNVVGAVVKWTGENKELVQTVAKGVIAFLGLAAAIKVVGIAAAVIASPLGAIGVAVGILGATFGPVFEIAINGSGELTDLLVGVAAAVAGVVVGVKVLAVGLGLLLNPITWIALGVGAAIAAFVKFTDVGKKWAAGILRGIMDIGKFFKEVFGGIISALKKGDLAAAWDIAGKALHVSWLAIIGNLKAGWYTFTNYLRDAFNDAALEIEKMALFLEASLRMGFYDAVVGVINQLNKAHAALKTLLGEDERDALMKRAEPELAPLNAEMKKEAAVQEEALRQKKFGIGVQEAINELRDRKLKGKTALEELDIFASDEYKTWGREFLKAGDRVNEAIETHAKSLERSRVLGQKWQEVFEKYRAGDKWIDPAPFKDSRDRIEREVKESMRKLDDTDAADRKKRNDAQEMSVNETFMHRMKVLTDMRRAIRDAEIPEAAKESPLGAVIGGAAFAGIQPGSQPLEDKRNALGAVIGGAAFAPRRPVIERFGDAVKGLYESADFKGSLGIGPAAKDTAGMQLDATKEIAAVLKNEINRELQMINRELQDVNRIT